ncbi:MAG: hypothetical protein RLZZ366_2277 [Pseudomonadota bacterium]
MISLPMRIGHAVDQLAASLLADPPGLCHPIAQAIAAKSREAHQINVLRIRPVLEVRDQPAEGRRRYGIIHFFIGHEFEFSIFYFQLSA